ncbi:FAD-dependent oxidoreductase [Clostridium sp. AF32-12BH]|uniref:FAD-dependent oxidoreductase n=1 Tax=Clostridium sp. AF32-12BH TaxID=2292006 RepID=UPI000E4CFFAD|nr:FAD-dependent oxidoreductase [Clostridium sp. AF32-12BH]RHP48568.1 FAD-dependent oxidoreductase [Clostridium sp. AF32-12BH]
MKFRAMFQPIEIGNMTVKNRFVVPPMGNNFANTDGTMSEQSAAYYAARAKGGFGLITIEATVVHPDAKGGPRKPCLYDDTTIESFRKVIDACHAYGAKVSIQLQNAGPEGNAKNAGAPIKAASSIQACCGRDIPETLTTGEIYELIEGYGAAAERALKAGADAVEVHMAHGYLVNSFISPRTNKRVDEFGGCFENRMRFSRLIIENIRERVGDQLAILVRINSADEVLGGNDVHDSAAIAAYLEDCGIDALHVSRAVHIRDEFMWAPTAIHGGFSADLVSEIKRAVTIPVITVGRFTEPQYAELLVREGRADLVAFGRQSLADPELPNKALKERLEDMIPCIACLQGCVPSMYQGKPLCCLTNPFLGHESAGMEKAKTSKRVMVVGGGVSGLCAAFVAAERGHDVTLYEAGETLGGNMRLAAFPPGKGDITNMVRAYIHRCEKDGVRIVMNQEVTLEQIQKENPDAVIVATGAKPLVLPIEGIDQPEILSGSDVLDGRCAPGKKVLVVGGGMVGCEIAALLGEQEHEVDVIELRDEIGADVIKEHKIYLMKDFEQYQIGQITGAKVSRFYKDGVAYETADGGMQEVRGYDSVVLAMGYKNYNPFADGLKALGKEVYVIGDAGKARRALDATKEAYEAAMKL